MVARVFAGLGLLLVAFHAWLFAGHVWTGELSDVAVLTRWLVAGGLLFGLRQLRRQGARLFFGRRAVALWVLAALLHGPALAERMGVDAPAPTAIAVVLTPASVAAVFAGLALLLALALRWRRRAPRAPRPVPVGHRRVASTFLDAHPLFAPRPPPIN
jgi:hypothetical protein